MKKNIIIVLSIVTGLLLSGCVLNDDYLDDNIRELFEKDREENQDDSDNDVNQDNQNEFNEDINTYNDQTE